MSALRLGRLVLERPLVGVRGLTSRGALTFQARASTRQDTPWSVLMLRRQVEGLAGQVAPVTWTGDRTLDGFYRIVDTQAALVEHAPDAGVAILDLAVTCEPFARGVVDFESSLTGATLVNTHGLPGGTPWLATPAGVEGLRSDPPPTRLLRSSSDGLVRVWTGVVPAPGKKRAHALWSVDPASFYDAAVTVRQNLAVVTGRFPADPPGICELSNGMCRVRWIVGEVDWDQIDGTWDDMGDLTWDDMGGIAGVEVAVWNGTAWVGKVWDIGITPSRVAVSHNDPHACTVRLLQELSVGRRYVDLTLRRGAPFVHVHHHGIDEARSILRETAEAATAMDGGVKASAATNGVTYVAATVHAKTDDLTQGGFTQPAASDRFTFMLGGAVTDTPEDLVARWVSYSAEDVEAVLR